MVYRLGGLKIIDTQTQPLNKAAVYSSFTTETNSVSKECLQSLVYIRQPKVGDNVWSNRKNNASPMAQLKAQERLRPAYI